ncbi:MAG TPA: riboflavin synthase [Chitinophagaceae bacterium]|nr:MAG: riboflavin synthase subunit alpha [Bacteroidetes bacterium OLB11]HMN32088.1 riboflavin synthase [Chitinophagaceae bacterium]
MFTGIIETIGVIQEVKSLNHTLQLKFFSPFTSELKVDQSVAHNGVCLTITDIQEQEYTVCAVQETIDKTTIGTWQVHDIINLERCLIFNGRLDGHIVQGHVDAKAICLNHLEDGDNHTFRFRIEKKFAHLIIEKGSVCIDGVSLTCFHVGENEFDVTIIPYTFTHTTFKNMKLGKEVNIEFDVIGKYITRLNCFSKSFD